MEPRKVAENEIATSSGLPNTQLSSEGQPIAEELSLTLLVEAGPHQGASFYIPQGRDFLLGRSDEAHASFPLDDRISRLHCRIRLSDGVARVVDLGSTNAVHVNGERVLRADLNDGDQLSLGHSVLRVRLQRRGSGKSPSVEEPNRIGNSILTYDILRELGRGGMGVVYQARCKQSGQDVALKVCKTGTSEALVERFLQDASILAKLNHPNIVRFHTIGRLNTSFYFAMEYIAGNDLAALVATEGPLQPGRAVRLMIQVLDALDYADREFRVVHRDIKPRNILVATSPLGVEHAKLTDFGLARMYHTSRYEGRTAKGGMGGTVQFMAPEQVDRFHEARSTADQYGAAATLYFLLTGQFAYDFPETFEEQLSVLMASPPVAIRKRNDRIKPGLAEVIDRGLERNPEARYPSLAAMRDALMVYSDLP